jgi:25S rRNA (uracil2634-N3)-methyltransferase
MRAFFVSTACILSEKGEVHVSHRNNYPYSERKFTKLEMKAGLYLIRMEEFISEKDYLGYHNKRDGNVSEVGDISETINNICI